MQRRRIRGSSGGINRRDKTMCAADEEGRIARRHGLARHTGNRPTDPYCARRGGNQRLSGVGVHALTGRLAHGPPPSTNRPPRRQLTAELSFFRRVISFSRFISLARIRLIPNLSQQSRTKPDSRIRSFREFAVA